MKPAPFAYHCPRTVGELLALLALHGPDGKVLAGGQSLVAAMNFRLARPGILFDINQIGELDYLTEKDGVLQIGALTRHAAFHKPVAEGPAGRLLSRVAAHVAHYPIRQRGTFAGSLAHADPAAEWGLVATVLDAEMILESEARARTVGAAAFFQGTFTTALAPDEVLREVRLPLLGPEWTTGFAEFSRRAGDFALAMALVLLRVEDGIVREARLGIGGVSNRPVRLEALEKAIAGQRATPEVFAGIASQASGAVTPSADIHASAAFRRDLIGTMMRRALAEAAM